LVHFDLFTWFTPKFLTLTNILPFVLPSRSPHLFYQAWSLQLCYDLPLKAVSTCGSLKTTMPWVPNLDYLVHWLAYIVGSLLRLWNIWGPHATSPKLIAVVYSSTLIWFSTTPHQAAPPACDEPTHHNSRDDDCNSCKKKNIKISNYL